MAREKYSAWPSRSRMTLTRLDSLTSSGASGVHAVLQTQAPQHLHGECRVEGLGFRVQGLGYLSICTAKCRSHRSAWHACEAPLLCMRYLCVRRRNRHSSACMTVCSPPRPELQG